MDGLADKSAMAALKRALRFTRMDGDIEICDGRDTCDTFSLIPATMKNLA